VGQLSRMQTPSSTGMGGSPTGRTGPMGSIGGGNLMGESIGSLGGIPRESRAAEALRMKDEQIRVLQEQNSHLLRSLDQVEEESNRLQLEKLAAEDEARRLREQNYELQSKARAESSALKKVQQEASDKDRQLKILSDQNAELLRLLEGEEKTAGELNKENGRLREELEGLRDQYQGLLSSAKTQEELAMQAAREGKLRGEELRLLRSEAEQLRSQSLDMKRKAQVEIESLQEQLRVRKEKQYALLEKAQSAEEAQRKAEDQAGALEERLQGMAAKVVELETQLQVEARAKAMQQEANKELANEEANLRRANLELQQKIESVEAERVRLEAEARDAGDQLREMAEKVFQLLERLKLAELGKTKAVEAVRTREAELAALRKKAGRLVKESSKEGQLRVKAEMVAKELADQMRALRQHNGQLAARSKEEVRAKLKEHEERQAAEDKVRTLSGRLTFLLNKLQADEEAKVAQREEIKRLEAQLRASSSRGEELAEQLSRVGESNRVVAQALREKTQELQETLAERDALRTRVERGDGEVFAASGRVRDSTMPGAVEAAAGASEPSPRTVEATGGKGRFYVESQAGTGVLSIQGGRPSAGDLVRRLGINEWLRRAQKSASFKERACEKLAHVLGLLLVAEERADALNEQRDAAVEDSGQASRLSAAVQKRLAEEEEARRRTLLRYVHTVRDVASVAPSVANAVVLTDSFIGDEEAHALAAAMRGASRSIQELVLRGNAIGDEGARAIGALLALDGCPLRSVDLRGNRIGREGITALAESLERRHDVKHVYVHAGGKIEALGSTAQQSVSSEDGVLTVDTLCVVDVRQNDPSLPGYTDPALASLDSEPPPRTLPPPRPSSGAGRAAVSESKGDTKRPKSRGMGPRKSTAGTPAPEPSSDLDILAREAGWQGRAGGMDIVPDATRRALGQVPTGSLSSTSAAAAAAATPSTSEERLPPLRG
jgi:hypothetical protein